MHRKRPDKALSCFLRAVELDPRYAGALHYVSAAYLYLGDASRAEVYARRAVAADAFSAAAANSLGQALLRQRRYEEARTEARRAETLNPGNTVLSWLLALEMVSHAYEGDLIGVGRIAERVRRLPDNDAMRWGMQAFAAALNRQPDDARRFLATAQQQMAAGPENPQARVFFARALTLLGEHDAAFAELEHATEAGLVDRDELRTDPFFAPLRSDPGFARIVALPAESGAPS
jgi:tetratricopeptide (TPR) repeat protein